MSEDRRIDLLVGSDPALAAIVAEHGRPEPFRREQGFPTLVLMILEQQVSLASAAAAYSRLAAAVDVTPIGIASLSDDELRTIGFSRQKTRYVRALGDAVESGRLDLADMDALDDDAVRAALTALPGIGPWTADVYLLAALQRPDIWPVGDRALQVGAAEALSLSVAPTPAELDRIGDRWRPHRSTAARLIWHGYLSRRGRDAPAV